MSYNIGSSIIIIGSIWLYFTFGLESWITIILCIIGAATLAYPGFSNERKRKFNAQIKMLEAKAEYYKKKTSRLGC